MTDRRIRFAWASMAVLAAVIVGASIVMGRRLARRIAVPIDTLHDRVSQLGADSPLLALPRSGMPISMSSPPSSRRPRGG